MTSMNLPVLSAEDGLQRYLQEVHRFPMLDADEEYMLAKRYQEHDDISAAHRLVTSHLRLVTKIASSFRGYGLPVVELISEGNIGLMQAVKKFDPEKGFRLSTYAMWWIKAAIQEYILRSWSLVKMGTSAAQKRLFFNLRKVKHSLAAVEEGDLTPEHTREIADILDVSETDVTDMNRRMTGSDRHLNAPMTSEEGAGEYIDMLADPGESQEELLGEAQEQDRQHRMLARALSGLNERERHIFEARRLADEPLTLEDLSQNYGISRERVRQIEVRAFEKVQEAMLAEREASQAA